MPSVQAATCIAGLLAAISLSQQQFYDRSLTSNVVDFVLAQLVTKYSPSIFLPAINQTFLMGQGLLLMDNGTVLGLDTLRRVGDLETHISDESMQLNLTISFSNFTIVYNDLNVELPLLKIGGSFSTSILENEVLISITMRHKSLCLVELNRIEFIKLSDFRVGLKFRCEKCSSMVNWMARQTLAALNEVVRRIAQENVDAYVRSVLKYNEESVVCQTIQEATDNNPTSQTPNNQLA